MLGSNPSATAGCHADAHEGHKKPASGQSRRKQVFL
jgi:hypothetical protein